MQKERVIILHGLKKSPKHMLKIHKHLLNLGYDSHNLSYPSTKMELEELRENIWQEIKNLPNSPKTHFIGYSMGGILTRMILNKYEINNLGKVILIGTPNHGSKIVDKIGNNFIFKKIFGPAALQLSHSNMQDNQMNFFGESNHYEVGVITGLKSLSIIANFLLETKKNDGIVTIKSTKTNNMKDQFTLKSSHLFLPYRKKTILQITHFLENGKFDKSIRSGFFR